MIYYLIIATVLFWGAWTKRAGTVYKFCFFALAFLMAFRSMDLGGSDGGVYQIYFYDYVPRLPQFHFNVFTYDINAPQNFSFGWAYALLNSIVKTVFPSYELFQVVYIALTMWLLAIVIESLKLKNYQKCLFLFFYLTQQMLWYFCGLLRQNIADLIIWYILFHSFEKHDTLKKIALFLLAYQFHSSVLPLIVLVPVCRWLEKIDVKKKAVPAVIGSAFLFAFGDNLVGQSIAFMSNYVGDRYSMYMQAQAGSSNAINYLLRMCIFILVAFLFQKIHYENKEQLLNASLMCMLLGSLNMELFVRALEYFSIGNYAGLSLSLKAFAPQSRRLARICLFFGFIVIFLRFFLVNGRYLQQYSFFWS